MDVLAAVFPPALDASQRPDDGAAQACARLGRPREDVDEDGYEREILAGAVDGDRLAWVERRARTSPGGWEDVDYHLRVQVGDVITREWTVDTYNPYFGCDVGALRLYADTVVTIYREKHATVVVALGPAGAPRMRWIADDWRIVGDVVLFRSESRGLVERLALPDLAPLTPLPAAIAAAYLSSETPIPFLAGRASSTEILARLPGIPGPLAELLVGALAYRYWDDWPPLAARYDDLDRTRWNPPCWLPFYAQRAAHGAAGRAVLDALDAAARRPAAGDGADPAELACRHLAARARELAAACRAGRLPGGTSCYFWVEWSQRAFTGSRDLFPPGLWATWTELAPRARELLALGADR